MEASGDPGLRAGTTAPSDWWATGEGTLPSPDPPLEEHSSEIAFLWP